MTAYTYHWKTSPAKRNSGRKTKLSERDRCILKRIVSKNHRIAAATQYLSEVPVSTKTVRRDLHKSSIHGRFANAKPLITENKSKKRKRWCDDLETWRSDDWKYVIWSDDRPSRFSQHQAESVFGKCPRQPKILNDWFQL
jgi:hypothetical protein